ncbi:MAG TPA: pyruvate kinase [Vicinamibacterales bacterium]|nr:pyruvate kinase [Vicinamibacterales bacterium]
MRKTKIIATVGPATSAEAPLRDLIAAGVDVFRLNFSHGSHEAHGEVVARIRALAAEAGRSVALLQDLSGPKIRTGLLRDHAPIPLTAGDELVIAVGDFVGEPGRVSTRYEYLPSLVKPGDTLLLDDGRLELRVAASDRQQIRTVVVDGGMLGEHKGINAPGVPLPASGLTDKDKADLAFGVRAGVDFVAMSFVMSAADLRQTRAALSEAGAPDLPLVAKLERPEAIAALDEILHACDAVMVARGDLGLELPLQTVPRVQKAICVRARAFGVPVIVATQVLESMMKEPRPTRAEVSDAANAVEDGVDAVMLSGETAVGAYPIKAIGILDLVLRDAETLPCARVPLQEAHVRAAHGQALCEAAVTLAERGHAAAIIAVTRGGKTAALLSSLRPSSTIVAVTDQEPVFRRLALWWGVAPLLHDLSGDIVPAARRIGATLVSRGIVPSGSPVVLVSMNPDLGPGPSNFMKLQRI